MLIKTSELAGSALDWAVETAEGYGERYMEYWKMGGDKRFIYCDVTHCPSSNWAQGGPIIERENLDVCIHIPTHQWCSAAQSSADRFARGYGPTPLIAAMRCYVASKLGDTVEIPDELMV